MRDPDRSNDIDETVVVGERETTRKLNLAAEGIRIDRELSKSDAPLLIVIRGVPQGQRYSLDGRARLVLGRGTTADIQIDDANVSRHHAEVFVEDGRILVADLGSRNGTLINDDRIDRTPVALAKEDMIKVGNTILKYLPAGELETLYHMKMADAAHRDALTGLFNRGYISEVLEVEYKRARALHTRMSVIFFDIDDFKKVNDTHGHACGDHVLISLGAFMRSLTLGEHDLASRHGGEEFMVVLTSANLEQAADVGERIRRGIEEYEFRYHGITVPVTVSVGVSTITSNSRSASDLYLEADKAMYASKRNGKNRVTVA